MLAVHKKLLQLRFLFTTFLHVVHVAHYTGEAASAFRHKREKKHGEIILLILSNRFSTSFAYYGLAMDLQKFGVNIYLMQIIFGAVDFPAKLVALAMLSFLGLRLTQATCLLTSTFVIFANIFVPKGKKRQTVCLTFILKCCYGLTPVHSVHFLS